ncbi:facilitated trehalose transporter Tret1-like [Diabrotica virgifera virgifera]|uniref:Major facilitator superfamily (MFS) profile domain-containing protein n=1 Tax=Diabrotica virgifera virgifera TaxID=50390 RepID=A0ABM5JJV7_DIAVI|nr:facilitated trehalose transporter Tret1-like [Diabrotica virgifera virgifera]
MGVLWTFNAFRLNKGNEDNEKEWPQALAIVIGCLAALTTGMLTSWSSPFLLKITKDKENYDISEHDASFFTIVHPAAMIVTCVIFSILCDTIGRKKTLLLITIPHLLSWVLAALAQNVYVFYASRICAGIGDGCMYAALPMYIGEVASPKVRGTWGNCMVSAMYLGEFLIHVIGCFLGVKETSYACIPLVGLFFVLFCFMPESPYYCVIKGKEDEAKQALKFLKRKHDIEEDYEMLKNDVKRQMSESGTWKDFFMIKSNRKALMSAIFLRSSQQLGGTTVFIMNTQFIFEKAKGGVSPEVSSMIYLGLCLILNIVVIIFVVERLGRRLCYILSLSLSAIPLLVLSVYFFIDQHVHDVDISFLNWIPIVAMISYLIFNSFGMAVIPTLMLGELFSTSVKSKAMTVLMIDFGLMIFVTNNILYALQSVIGLCGPFLFFAICNIISTFLSFFLVPETRGKTLEQIQQTLKKEVADKHEIKR